MPEVVSFTAPGQVALVAVRRRSRSRPGSVRVRTWYSGISAGTELTAYRGLEPVPHPHLGPRPPAVRRRATPTFAYPVEGWGYSEVGEVVEVADGRRRHRRSATSCTASGATAARRWCRPTAVARRTWSADDAHLGHLRAGRLDRPQRRAGRRRPDRRPGRGLRPGRHRAARHPAGHARRRRGRRRRHAARAGSRPPAPWAPPRPWPPTRAGGAGAVVREWSGGGVDAAIELSGSDRALHEAVRSVVVDGTVVASGFYQGGAANLRLGEEFHHNRVRIVASQISGTPVGLGAALGPAPAGAHVHGAGPARAGRRGVAGHRRRRRRRRGRRLRAARPRRPRRSSRPCCASRPPGARVTDASTPARASRPTAPAWPSSAAARIAQSAHLPAYEQHGVGVTGVWSRSPATTATVPRAVPVRRAASTPAPRSCSPTPRSATSTWRPAPRAGSTWIEAAVDGGKHVLAQKPLTLSADDLARLPDVLAKADAAGVRVAVNHNGRWAPPWRAATLLLRRRRRRRGRRRHPPARQAAAAAGRHAVRRRAAHAAHRLPPALGRHHPDLARRRTSAHSVQAADSRVPGQPADARNPWSATLSLATAAGATATLRIAGNVVTSEPGVPVLGARHDRHAARQRAARLRPPRARRRRRPRRRSPLSGAWFVDGFAAAMGELMCAVAEDRAAGELRRRRRPVGRAGPRRPRVRRSAAAHRSTRRRSSR